MTTATQKIPSGYKQTEIGVIPVDWRISSINDLGTIIDGDRGSNYPNGDDFSEYGYCLFLNAKNVTKNGFRFEDVQFIKKEKDAVLSKGKLKRGDIVLTTRGTVGNIAFFDKDIPYENIRINSGMVIIRIDEINGVTPDYYHKLTQSNLLTNQIDRLVFGSAQPQLTVKSIATFQFPVPTQKNEQKSIAVTLFDADALIGKLEKLIEKKKNIKHGVIQELLIGKRRLHGFNTEWQKVKLGELFSLSATYSKIKFLDEGGNFLIMDMGSISSEGKMIALKRTSSPIDLLKTGDLVMPKDDIGGGNIIGKVAYIDQDNRYVLSDHVYKLTAKTSEINTLYFSYLINSNAVSTKLKKKVAGSAQLGLGRKSVEDQDVDCPKDKDEQIAIATVLSDMDIEIEKLESQLTKYQNIKQGMMQTLLTGKIRLLTK
jgi:type I restriction enzyme S subunit